MTATPQTTQAPKPVPPRARAPGQAWLAGAMSALAILAAAAAAVSWDAQYVLVAQARRVPVIAALEAGIPDAGAAVFAALGIALALHGHRALRPRALNVACVGISLTMNAMAAQHGWRGTAIWIMPAAVYALASDTLIGVVRAWAIARMRVAGRLLAADVTTPLAVAGAVMLWLLRLLFAPASTLSGFRRWVIAECPAAPRQSRASQSAALPPTPTSSPIMQRSLSGGPSKQDQLIALAGQRYDLHSVPLGRVSAIATALGGEVDLHAGTARRVLRAHVLSLQNHAAAPLS